MVQSPDAVEMHVLIRSPSPCSSPDRKSRVCPDSSGRTHVWQMPIREPNGIWMPTFSPASRSDVAPSISMRLSEMQEGIRPADPPVIIRFIVRIDAVWSNRVGWQAESAGATYILVYRAIAKL